MSSPVTRHRVIALYKDLHRIGRDYPDPAYDFHGRMRRLFESVYTYQLCVIPLLSCVPVGNKTLTDPAEIEKAIKLGEYIKNETLALYQLRKYRHLRRMYPPPEDPPVDPLSLSAVKPPSSTPA